MNSTAELPYELHTHGCGAFVIFNVAEQIALPLIGLAKAMHRTARNADELVLEFQDVEIAIDGRSLESLFEHLLAGRVKRISRGRDDACEITDIRITETT